MQLSFTRRGITIQREPRGPRELFVQPVQRGRRLGRPRKLRSERSSSPPSYRTKFPDSKQEVFEIFGASQRKVVPEQPPWVNQSLLVSSNIALPEMARNLSFVPFDQGNPLRIANHNNIPLATLKGLPSFTREGKTTAIENIRDIASLCNVHHIMEEDVALKLLVASLKGKALEWFKTLLMDSNATWDVLGERLSKFFEDKFDNLSLVEELTTIKRAPQEEMSDFNLHFQKTWNKIPTTIRFSIEYAFLYFLKSLNNDISVMIQSTGAISLPQAFDIAIRVENSLIQVGKIAPRPHMPFFPSIRSNMPLVVPHLSVVPSFKSPKVVLVAPLNELQSIKDS